MRRRDFIAGSTATAAIKFTNPVRAQIDNRSPIGGSPLHPTEQTGALPAGVTLQAIDGETMLSPTTMSNNYYGRSGFTVATNTSFNGTSWDDPSFFPIGVDYAFYPMHSPATFKDLGLNFAMRVTRQTPGSFFTTSGIWNVDGPVNQAMVGFHVEEPRSEADINRIFSVAGSALDGRFVQISFTWNQFVYGTIGSDRIPAVMSMMRSTSVGPRHIDIPTADIYWMSGSNTQANAYGPTYAGHMVYGTASNLAPDQMGRGSNYGDMVDAMRQWLTTHPAPCAPYIENSNSLLTDSGVREILPKEWNWAVWSTIVHGARWLLYFGATGSHQNQFGFNPNMLGGQSISLYGQAKATNTLVTNLARVLNSSFAIHYASVNPNGYSFPNWPGFVLTNGIELMSKLYKGGTFTNAAGTFTNGFYIFACVRGSPAQTNLSATFVIADTSATQANVIGEGRSIPIRNGTFTDTFATAYTNHIYQIVSPSSWG
jgi:hypothetical protein